MNTASNIVLLKVNKEISEQDLHDIADARPDFNAAVTVGSSSAGAPAYGWVRNLRVFAGKLYADLTDLPDEIATALRTGKVKKIAASVYQNLRRGGKEFRRALKSINLQGITAPEVKLQPAGVMEFSDFRCVRTYELDDSDESAGEQVARRVREYREAHPEVKFYEQALSAVLNADPDLAHAYAGWSAAATPEAMDAQRARNAMGLPDARQGPPTPGWRIHQLMLQEIARDPTLTMMQALKAVLEKNQDLADEYRRQPTSIVPNVDAILGSGGAGR